MDNLEKEVIDLKQKIESQQFKIDAIYVSVEKTRKYFLWTFIITVVLFVLPLIGLIFVMPSFLSIYGGGGSIDSLTNASSSLTNLSNLGL